MLFCATKPKRFGVGCGYNVQMGSSGILGLDAEVAMARACANGGQPSMNTAAASNSFEPSVSQIESVPPAAALMQVLLGSAVVQII